MHLSRASAGEEALHAPRPRNVLTDFLFFSFFFVARQSGVFFFFVPIIDEQKPESFPPIAISHPHANLAAARVGKKQRRIAPVVGTSDRGMDGEKKGGMGARDEKMERRRRSGSGGGGGKGGDKASITTSAKNVATTICTRSLRPLPSRSALTHSKTTGHDAGRLSTRSGGMSVTTRGGTSLVWWSHPKASSSGP